jgi:hypothetical protein
MYKNKVVFPTVSILAALGMMALQSPVQARLSSNNKYVSDSRALEACQNYQENHSNTGDLINAFYNGDNYTCDFDNVCVAVDMGGNTERNLHSAINRD